MSKKKNTAGKSGDVTQKLFVEAGTGIGHEKDGQRRCLGCMELYSEEYEICPYCGYTIEEEVENALHMFPGTVLYDKYIIGRVIGYGGFGVTYLAWDTVLQIKVAIKEYLPSEFSTRAAGQTQVTVFSGDKSKQFSDGMEKFIDEAKRLAKFRSENGIVKIFDSFSENGTAYIAMEYLQGETLAERLERDKTIPVEESIQMLMPIIESLNRVHDEGIIHRDIAPDNIFLTNKGEVKLIDFGASRYATTSRSRSLTVIIKPGYSAEEQYRSRGDQGSHTDVYSVGAVLYRMVTGQAPPDAMERRALFEKNGRDMLIPIKKFDKNIDQRRENAIYNSLNIRIEDRTPDMISLAGELLSEEPVKKRRSGIKKIDPLTWPLWAKIGIPSGLVAVVTLCVLLAFGVIGPKSGLETDFIVPEGQVLIPNIVAESVEDAQETLREESLTPKIHDKIESAIIDRNLVLRQDPDALNVVNKGSIVNIIISDGRGMALIPDVVGLSLEFATQQLEERGFVVATEEEASEIIAQGAVISMDFEPNTDVEKGTTVTLKISTGPENVDRTKQVKVPNIVGLDYEQAKKVLAKYKLMAAIDDETYNSSIPENQVVGQLPYENANAFQGDTVYVTVNRKQKMVDIVNYVGKPFDDVAWELREKGLVVEAKYVQNKDYSEGRICAQNIENKSVPVGTKIVFSVSEGYLVQVPDVKGERQNQAEKILTDLGLEVNSVTEYSDTVGKGKVIRNDLVGEKVEQGTLVTIVVSEGKKPDDAEEEEPVWQQQTIGLTSINIATKPTRTEYYVGDKFNSSGISVVANYSDSSNKNITSQCRFTGTEFNYKGSATVTVTYEEGGITKTASFDVKVLEPEVSISESNIVVTEGGSASLNCTTKPSGQSVTWSVDDSSVATVSNGSVKGVSEGRATVWATLNYNGKQYTSNKVTVTVEDETETPEPTSLTISDGENIIKIQKGNEKDLDATFNQKVPEDKKGIKWTSSDSSIVQVKNASTGVVYGIKPGKATITATSTEYGIKDTCVVEVCEPEVRSIEVTKYPEYIYQGETIDRSKVEVVITYVLGDTKRVTLSDNADIKMTHDKLDTNGTKTVTVSYGGKTAMFKINVESAFVRISNKGSVNKKLEINGSAELKLDYSPKEIGSTVKWSVSPSGIVVVDNNGVVTAKKAGTATVTVTGSHKGKTLTDSVVFTVSGSDSVKGIEIEKNPGKSSTYYLGDSYSTKDMKISLIKSSGASETLTSGFSVTPEKFTKAGSQTMTVKYGSFTTTFDVDVKTPSVSISQSDFTLDKGKTKSIQASPKPDKDFEIVWESSAPGIAKVTADSSSSGKMNATVTAVEGGDATITAKIKYKGTVYASDTVNVTVKAEKVLSSIQVSGTPTNTQYIGDDFDPTGLTVKAVYSDGTSQNVTGFDCSQSNKTQATQDITVSYGGKTATYRYTFKTPTISYSFQGGKKAIDLAGEHDNVVIQVNCTPDNGNWKIGYSTDSSAITVNSDSGLVKGVSETTSAKVKITATYNSSYTTTLTTDSIVVHKSEAKIQSVTLHSDGTQTYKVGDTIDRNGYYAVVNYDSGEPDNRNTEQDKLIVTFKNGSTLKSEHVEYNGRRYFATVYVKYTVDGTEYATKEFEVTVDVPTPTLSLNTNSMTINKGDSDYVGLSISNLTFAESQYTVEWSTSSSAVSLSGNSKSGVTVKGVNSGSATVTATLKYNGSVVASDSFTVTVEDTTTTTTTTTEPPTGGGSEDTGEIISDDEVLLMSDDEYGY